MNDDNNTTADTVFPNDVLARERGYEPQYDNRGFDQMGFHRDTCTGFDHDGYDSDGFNQHGYDRDGYDSEGYDPDGYDRDGYDSEGYNSEGFNCDGIHCDTGTMYNEDGYDCYGNERENEFNEHLESYGTDAIVYTGYRFPEGSQRMLLAGHEIEMYSDDVDPDDIRAVVRQFNNAWQSNGYGPNRRACLAKHDGSLDDDGTQGGFEVVTVPLTPQQTYAIFGSFPVLNGGSGSVSAWPHGSGVGHHIHVNAAAVSAYTTGKLGVFLNHPFNRGFVEAIAQRIADYNSFENDKKLTSLRPRFRHSVLNHTGDTIEFRMFKSNLRTSGILKNYEFAISSIMFCQQASHSRLDWEEYVRWLAEHTDEYKYLSAFIHRDSGRLGRVFQSALRKNVSAKLCKANDADRRHTA